MELCKHCNLRDAGKRRLDYVDAYVEGREPKDLREPETHERANHESPEEDEREVLVEADVADPDRVDQDPVEDQCERRRDAAEVLCGRENGARNEHVREDKGDGGEKADERRREDAPHRFLGEQLRALGVRRFDAVHGFEEVPHRPEVGRVRKEIEKRGHDRFVSEQRD